MAFRPEIRDSVCAALNFLTPVEQMVAKISTRCFL
jgi:hypothetical protein